MKKTLLYFINKFSLIKRIPSLIKGVFFLYFFISIELHAQNLIQNSSFEVYSTCPEHEGQVNRYLPWFSPTFYGTLPMSDAFNNCDH